MDTSDLINFYENESPESMRLCEESFQYIEYITAMKYIKHYLPNRSSVLDTCAGTGIYSSALADCGHDVTACDIVPHNVKELEKSKEKYKSIHCLDARDLSLFPDESFDMVLCMGALYHLSQSSDRAKVLSESRRVLKKGGILITTHVNRYAVIINNLHLNIDNMVEIEDFLVDGNEDVFYCATPSTAADELKSGGFYTEKTIALDGMTTFMFDTHKLLDAKYFDNFVRYHLQTCEEPSLLGYSYHFMTINKI